MMRIAFLAAGILACTFSGTAVAEVFKIATIAPEGSEWMVEHRAAADRIKERTEGRVVLKFYGGGVMGNDKKVLRKMRIGQLQGAAFTSSGLAERYPDIILYGLPFLFESQEEVDFIRAKLDQTLIEGLREAGFVSFGFAGGGFANFMSSEPVVKVADLQGKKIWVPDGDVVSFKVLESMNLSPVVLPLSDVLTGLQTGLLDVIVTPPSAALLLQWYTKVSYINPVPVSYTMGILALDERAFERLSPEDQAVVNSVMRETYERFDVINRDDNVEAQDALLDNGLEVVEPNPEDVPVWRADAMKSNRALWAELAQDKELFAKVESLLEDYRANQSTPVARAN